eukprot:7383887-Prymnesium_polylepis.1
MGGVGEGVWAEGGCRWGSGMYGACTGRGLTAWPLFVRGGGSLSAECCARVACPRIHDARAGTSRPHYGRRVPHRHARDGPAARLYPLADDAHRARARRGERRGGEPACGPRAAARRDGLGPRHRLLI